MNFLLFGGDSYYAAGGWDDYLASYDNLDKAVEDGKKRCDEHSIDWFHVMSTVSEIVVYRQGTSYAGQDEEENG